MAKNTHKKKSPANQKYANTHKKNTLSYFIEEVLDMTQQEFADKLIYSIHPINKVIARNEKVSIPLVKRIKEIFHIPSKDLFKLLFDKDRRCKPLTNQLKHDIKETFIKIPYHFLDNYTLEELNFRERNVFFHQKKELENKLAFLEISENNCEYMTLIDNIKSYTNACINSHIKVDKDNLLNPTDIQGIYFNALSHISRYVAILNTQQLPDYILEEVLSSLEILTGIKPPETEHDEKEKLQHKIITNVKDYEKEKSQETNELLKLGIISKEDL